MIVVAVLSLLFAVIIYDFFAKKRMNDAVANLGGPFNMPIVGSIQVFYDTNPKNFLSRSIEFGMRYGRVMRIWAFNRLIVPCGDLEMIEQLLASQEHIVKQRNYKLLHQWLGVGLLMSDGRKWYMRRKVITPTFHFKILEQFVEVFDNQSNIFVERLMTKADGRQAFDVYPYVCLAALDIIAETAMGTEIHAQTDDSNCYAAAVNEMTKLMAWRFMRVHLNSELIFSTLYPHLKRRQMQLIRIMHDFTAKVIEGRRQSLLTAMAAAATTCQGQEDPAEDVGVKRRSALLDVLLQATIDGKPLSNEDIREEVDTFMFEGHDTTTSAICFCLHAIARHPSVQEKLHDEVMRVLGTDRSRSIALADLSELKYAESVIKETLRLYPSVPIIGRDLQEDFRYKHSKLGEGVIPAGAEVLIGIYGMLRDPDSYENPLDFIPERHDCKEAISPFAFIPFSAGPRNCIGQKFAMLEMKMIIAKVVRAYELLPLGESVQPELNIVLRSSNGFQMGLRDRTIKTDI